MFPHAFSTLLYGIIGYALLQAIIVAFWGIRGLRFRRSEVTTNNLEQIIRGWLGNSGLSAIPVSDPTWKFGLLTTLAGGQTIYIIQMNEPRPFIAFQASLAISPEHQAILKAMPTAYFEKLAQEVALKVFLARMVLATRTRLSDVSLFSQLAIATELSEDDFRKGISDMDNAIALARDTILLGVERAPRLVNHRDIRMDERR